MSGDDETMRATEGKTVPAARSKSGPPPLPAKPKSAKKSPPPLAAALPKEVEKAPAAPAPESKGAVTSEEAFSPTVGWLVIMDGPGRGASFSLGFGMNHVGRSASNRHVIDFGDEEISRKTHTTVTYDPRGKKFYVQPGSDTTCLTYSGQEPDLKPVFAPTEIFGGEMILVGKTKLKFIAFCGPQFSWA